MNSDDKRIGISLCLTSMAAYAIQDGITKVLVSGIPATQIVMIRCWVLLLLFGERLELSLVIGAVLLVVGGLLLFGRLKG